METIRKGSLSWFLGAKAKAVVIVGAEAPGGF